MIPSDFISRTSIAKYFFALASAVSINNSVFGNELYDVDKKIVNSAPTDIQLSNTVIFVDDQLIVNEYGWLVGILATSDPDVGDDHTYTLAEGGDNEGFMIENNEIQLSGYFQNIQAGNYEITVTSFDGEFSIDKTFTLIVIDEKNTDVFSYGNKVTNYRIIAAPTKAIKEHWFAFGDFVEGGGFGARKGIDYEIFRFHRTLGAVVIPSNSILRGGEGYWCLVNNEYGSIRLQSFAEPVILNNRGEFEMELQAGWNLIGNPFRENMNWDEELSHNISEGYILSGEVSRLYSYTGAYNLVSTLSMYQGAFVKASKATTIYLRKPNYFSGVPDARLSARQDLSNNDVWELDIVMSNKDQSTNLGGIGMRAEAKVGVDMYDKVSPPPPSDEYVFQWEDDFGLFRNVVAPQENYTWEYKVRTDKNEVRLSWDSEKAASLDKELWMELLPQGNFVNLKMSNEVSYEPASNQRIKLYYGILPEMFQLESYPNPAKDKIAIRLYSSSEGKVTILVSDVNGRRLLVDSRKVESGQNQWKWDLVDSNGERVSPGLYFYKVTMNSLEEKTVKVLVK